MSLVLIILLPASVLLLLAACIYPFSILALILQFLFLILAVFVYLSKRKKSKKSLRTFLALFSHSIFFILVLLAFIFVSLPLREEGDIDTFSIGIKKLISSRLGISLDTKETTNKPPSDEPGVNNTPEEKPKSKVRIQFSNSQDNNTNKEDADVSDEKPENSEKPENKPKETVKDPF